MNFHKLSFALILLLSMGSNIFAQGIEGEELIEEEILEEEILEETISSESVDTTVEEVLDNEGIKPTKTPTFKSSLSGNIRGDYRYYPKPSLYPGQKPDYFSTVFNPEIYFEWNDGKQTIQFTGFAKLNQHDKNQTRYDIRELYFRQVLGKWEISLGAKKIFWGFTESNHLVNVINQDDVLEGSDVKNKLGQPMFHLSTSQKWGNIDFMVMPYHRQIQFPGVAGRGRPPFDLGNIQTVYESEMEEYNPDMALRWSHSIKNFDVGLSHFYGSTRVPLFVTTNGFDYNIYYELIHQSGLELQATTGAMLWKFEGIHRYNERRTIKAMTVGGEYTFSNVWKADVGFLVEYTYDDRNEEAINALNDDFFFGMRIAANDKQSTDFLGGVNWDREKGTTTLFAEANRRLGETWKISIRALGFENVDQTDFVYLLRNDGFVEFQLAKYF